MPEKIAFITGAARGLGREIAVALGRDGHALYLVDILGERLDETADELRAAGHRVETRVVDVSARDQCAALQTSRLSLAKSADRWRPLPTRRPARSAE